MMRSASREAVAALRRRQQSVSGEASAADLTSLAGELYSIADLLVSQPRLRRILGDPASPVEARIQTVRALLGSKVGASAVAVTEEAVSQRWSTPWDLTDALELAGDDMLFAAAEKDGRLDEVEGELFRFERIISAESRLVTLLDDASVPADRRTALLRQVLGGKVNPITLELLAHAVASQRKRSVTLSIDDLLEAAAARRERSVARVVSAVELTDAQQSRLVAALSDFYGRSITVRTAVDPSVRGGLVIRVGDEVIDGSIAHRLAQARTALAG